jgi:DNA invertase Pin-like site-specific DNA recombinase
MSRIWAYIRASTDQQDIENQRQEILAYAGQQKIAVDEFVEIYMFGGKSNRRRRIAELQARLSSGDSLLVAELTRLGNSTGEVITLIDQLLTFGVSVTIIRQNLHLNAQAQGGAAQVTVSLFALIAEMERDFVSQRMKEALQAKKAAGVVLGKPRGTIQASMYDKDRERIKELLNLGVSQKRIVELHLGYGTSNSLNYYIRTRGLPGRPEEDEQITF